MVLGDKISIIKVALEMELAPRILSGLWVQYVSSLQICDSIYVYQLAVYGQV